MGGGQTVRISGAEMSDERCTMSEDIIELIDVHDKLVTEAVDTERERCTRVARTTNVTVCPPAKVGEYIAERIERTASELGPEPPAPEPMTVDALVAKMKDQPGFSLPFWDNLEADLTALVEAQARRDVEKLDEVSSRCHPNASNSWTRGWIAACQDARKGILESAGTCSGGGRRGK